MKIVERIVMVLLLLILVGGCVWLYFSWKYKEADLREAVARGDYQVQNEPETEVAQPVDAEAAPTEITQDEWRKYYPVLIPILIGSTTVQASLADSLPERIKGLSDTLYLPDGIVKLFAFNAEGEHSIWMKDMNYPIDIIWVEKAGAIVHIKQNVSPTTYPKSFASPKPAWYVIETPAGFVAQSGIRVGDEVVVPE